MVDALFFCPRLQKLETSVHVIHALGCTSKEVVRHDSLRELTLRFDTFTSISGSLRTVQLPNLLSVELFSKSSPHAEFPSSGPASVRLGPNGHLSWLPDDFLFFLKNSACSLTSLSFRTFKLTDYDLGRIFELTPSLAHFSLREYGVSLGTGLLSSLTRSQENPIPLLPQLSHLEVHWHEHEHKPDDVLRLVAMVESRTHSKDIGFEGARMRKFALNFKYDLTQRGYLVGSEFLSRMKALYVSDGVDVSLTLAGEPITLSSR
ncbi:hypothetical protein VKT23_005265 [Stygiomarasmius scandens]|uniref:Uncharacterized protein n=1 Tax=Marasmiellus scandens TaxID=2682957 RepID=A0ABR1JSY8_9AGAR